MNKTLKFLTASLIIGSFAFTTITATKWSYSEDNYVIKFSSEDPSGTFKGLEGDVVFDINNLTESYFDVSVDVNTINTGNGMQNRHATSEKWLDAEKYPKIKFKSSSIKATDKGFDALGKLEMHGVTKEITIPFTFTEGAFAGTFQGEFMVNRNDYNIGSPGGKASEKIKVSIKLPVKGAEAE